MEQFEDMKYELQQELQDLQQNVEQHSTFNREVWQRAVKRHSKHLYMQNLLSVIFLVVIITASNFILCEYWPWWLLLPSDLFLGWITLDSLIATNGLRKADAQSREGLLSMRECMRKESSYSKRRLIIMKIVSLFGVLLGLAMPIYLYLYDRDTFVPVIVGILVASVLGGQRFNKRIKKESDDFVEEIDELLKE